MSELPHLHDQIDLIVRQEQEFLHRRTRSEKVGDALVSIIGNLWFVSLHAFAIAAWIVLNSFPPGRHFDPSPFPLLDTVVAIEAIFLACFIVMRQSRLSRRSDERNHLILQILILTEREITAVLSLQRQIAKQAGLDDVEGDAHLDQLSQATPIDELTERLNEQLPDP